MAADGSVVIQAVLDTAGIPGQVGRLKDSLDGVTWEGIKEGDEAATRLSGALRGAGTAATVGLTLPIAAAGGAAFNTAADYEEATSRIQAALGLTEEEAEALGEVGESIYEDGFGPSLEAVDDALVTVRQNLGDLGDADLAYVTESALTLSDVLGMDVGETVRGVGALMEGFGLDAQEAMDLFVAGAQNGLDFSGELGDNLAEYGPRFAEMGFSASDYFSILQAGAENGAYSLDKVNDFLNEFQTSLSDGRMEASIGSFSQGTQDLFEAWKTGGATGQQVYEAVLGELAAMPDGYEKARLASQLWGSLGEDNAMGMIDSLAGVEDAYGDVAGAAGEAGDAASDSFASKAQSAMREIAGALEPFGQPLLNIATNVANVMQAFGEWFASIGSGGQTAVVVIAGILAAVGPLLTLAGSLITVIPAIQAAMASGFGATLAAAAPVVAIVAAVAAAFVYLWTTSEEFRAALTAAWEQISAALMSAWAAIQPVLSSLVAAIMGVVDAVAQVLSQVVATVLPVITPIITTLIQIVTQAFTAIMTNITTTMNVIQAIITNAWTIIQGIFQTVIGLIQGIVTGDFSAMQEGISSIMSGIRGMISGVWSAIAGGVSGALGGIVSTVSGIFGRAKDAISNAINGARDAVSNAVNAIKGFFSFSFSWPHIPLPHFAIHPSGWKIGDLLKGSIPSLGIDWRAKGGVFNGATVIGVGEAGTEAVVPYNKRGVMPLAEGIAEELGSGGGALLDELRRLEAMLPAIIRENTARSIVLNKREFARVVWEVQR